MVIQHKHEHPKYAMNELITREEIPTSFAGFSVWTVALAATTIFEIGV